MKSLIIIALAIVGISSVQAGDYRGKYGAYEARDSGYCKPYVVCTHKISSCREKRMGYDNCGRCYYYYVTVVTYKDVYNTGTTRTYTKTFRA